MRDQLLISWLWASGNTSTPNRVVAIFGGNRGSILLGLRQFKTTSELCFA